MRRRNFLSALAIAPFLGIIVKANPPKIEEKIKFAIDKSIMVEVIVLEAEKSFDSQVLLGSPINEYCDIICNSSYNFGYWVPFLNYKSIRETNLAIFDCYRYSRTKSKVYLIKNKYNKSVAMICLGEDIDFALNGHLKEINRYILYTFKGE